MTAPIPPLPDPTREPATAALVERLAVALNEAQIRPAEMQLGRDLRVPAARVLKALGGALPARAASEARVAERQDTLFHAFRQIVHYAKVAPDSDLVVGAVILSELDKLEAVLLAPPEPEART